MRDAPREERVRGGSRLIHVRVEGVAGEVRERLDVGEGDLALGRVDAVADAEVGERLAERVDAGGIGIRALMPHAGEGRQHARRPLDRGPLHVVQDRPDAAELLSAAGAAGPAVEQMRHGRAVACRGTGVVAVEEEDAPVVRADPTEELGRNGGIVRRDARYERAAAAPDELGGLADGAVAEDARDGAERLDLMHGGSRQGVVGVEGEDDRGDEGSVGRGTRTAAGAHDLRLGGGADDDATARALERGDLSQHLVALGARDERTHGDALGVRIAEDHALGELLAQGADERRLDPRRDDRPTDRGALLTRLRHQFGEHLPHERVELGRARHGVGPEHRRVDRIGLACEPHPRSRLHAQALSGRGTAGEPDGVAQLEEVEQARHRAAHQLEGAAGQQARVGEDPHPRLGEVRGRGRGLDDRRDAREEGGCELLERPPHGEVEGVDLHRDAGQACEHVPAEERSVLREHLDRAVEHDLRVRQLAPPLRRVREQHADAAVDVDRGIPCRRPRTGREGVELLLAGREGLRELLQQQRALVEGHGAEARLTDLARVPDGAREVDARRADAADLRAGRGIAHDGGVARVGGAGRPPGILQVARERVGHESLHS